MKIKKPLQVNRGFLCFANSHWEMRVALQFNLVKHFQ